MITIYVALLRAVNVGGKNMIKMAELQRMFEAMGFARVQTYIQSGNVLFESEEEPDQLCRRIVDEIRTVFGLSVTVLLRTSAELDRILRDCPFTAADVAAAHSLHVCFLAEPPEPEAIDRLLTDHSGSDEFRLDGRDIYLLYRQPSHQSTLTNAFLEKRLRVTGTSRNWLTVCRLVALASGTGR